MISIVIFYTLIALFFIKRRKKIERQGIFILYRTQKGLSIITKLAEKYKRFCKAFGKLSIYVGFGGIGFILILLAYKAIEIITKPSPEAGVALAIPGVRIPGSPIFIPFWYGIIALVVVLLVHEGCHGLVAKAHGLKIKSAGIGLLAFLPLAFVEPDEKQLDKAPLKTRLAVFGAGPMANFTIALVVLLISAVIAPIAASAFEPSGLEITEVREGFPAENAGILPGDTIIGLNDKPAVEVINFSKELDKINPGDTIKIQTDREIFIFDTTTNPNNSSQSYIGISFFQSRDIKESTYSMFWKLPWLLIYLLQLFNWIFILNIGIGVINLLPLGPIDGGRMLKDTLMEKMKNEELAKKIFKTVSYVSLFLLIINIIGPYIMGI